MGTELSMKRTPALEFVYDDTVDTAMRIEQLLADGPRARRTRRDARHRGRRRRRGLRHADRLLLTTHENPDGDALGSLLGMHEILRGLGKDSLMFMPEPVDRAPARVPPHGASRASIDAPARRRGRAHDRLPRLRQHRPDAGGLPAARAGARAQHRPPPRQHALRHGQPRGARGLVHRGDRLRPRQGARRADHPGDRRGPLRRARHRHRAGSCTRTPRPPPTAWPPS